MKACRHTREPACRDPLTVTDSAVGTGPGRAEGTGRKAEVDRMRAEVAAGLARTQKEISPKYFYDHRGSRLFEEITQLPEYYPTRAERALLEEWALAPLEELRPVSLVELGAGSGEKTRILLEAIRRWAPGATYIPVDISADFLEDTAAALRDEYPDLRVRPVAADITAGFPLPESFARPALFALLGGTIGNFTPGHAAALLGRARARMEDGDRLLLGADLVKDVGVIEAAYNDARGVTAEFNLNVLHVLNRELGADFDVDCFRHRAFYNGDEHRIEMHLEACRSMTVTLPGAAPVHIAEGETIRTEISCKYDRPRIEALLRSGGLALDQWHTGQEGFALAVGSPI
jgi:L-histidine Nalpha-methyltransferase